MMLRSRRTVRMRLTALYCVLFVLSAVMLLAITNSVGSSSGGSQPSSPPVTATGSSAHKPYTPVVHASVIPAQSAPSHQYLLGSAIALGVMTVMSVAVGWVIAGRVLRPLRVMTATTQRISADSLHERLAMPGPRDELKDLADTIDALLARLGGAFAAQRRFVANASHELRTPLAAMRVSLDVAVAKPGPVPPETITLAGQVRAELEQGRPAAGRAARARPRPARRAARPCNAPAGLRRVGGPGRVGRRDHRQEPDRAARQRQRWHLGRGQPAAAAPHGRQRDRQRRPRHNRDGGWIRITTSADGGAARLIIENGGDILDPAQVAGLAQPFRRLGADRTGSDDGAGLGLSIVAAIAEAHRGSLDLQARPGGGLAVTITLPLAPRAAAITGSQAGVPA